MSPQRPSRRRRARPRAVDLAPARTGTFDISARPHPLRRDMGRGTVPEGCTLRDLGAGGHVQASVNGRPKRNLNYKPKAGELVMLEAVAGDTGGGGGDKDALHIIGMVAIIALSAYTGGAAGAAYGAVAGAAAQAAVGIGLTLALNALVPPSDQRLDSSNALAPFRTIEGTNNRIAPFGAKSKIFGNPRVWPCYEARPSPVSSGGDSFLQALFNIGYRPLSIDPATFRLGETLLSTFSEWEYEIIDGSGAPGHNGNNNDGKISLFPANIVPETINGALHNRTDTFTHTTPVATRRVEVDIGAAPLGLIYPEYRNAVAVGFKFEYSPAGAGTWTRFKPVVTGDGRADDDYPSTLDVPGPGTFPREGSAGMLFGSDTKNYIATFAYDLPSAGQWDIRITRLSWVTLTGLPPGVQFLVGGAANADRQGLYQEATAFRFRSILSDDFALSSKYAYVALKIKATDQLTGVIDDFNLNAQAMLPMWSGHGYAVAATSNPAWAYRDVLLGAANDSPVTTSRIDEAGLIAWAQDCDDAGREFEAELNGVSTVFETLKNIAAAGRAAFTIKDCKYSVVQDKAGATPVQMFTARNVRNFTGSKSFFRRPHAVEIKFKDRTKGWRDSSRMVYADGYSFDGTACTIPGPGGSCAAASRFDALALFGITNPDQVHNDGRYHMAVSRLRPETFTYETDIRHMVCQRGDLVRVQHDVLLVGLGTGRILSISGSTATLDEEFAVEAGKTYGLRTQKDDGSEVDLVVTNAPGSYRTLTFSTAVPGTVKVGDLAAYGETGLETLDALVTQIEPNGKKEATITAVPYSPAVFDAETGPIPAYDPGITDPPLYPAAPIILSIASGAEIGLAGSAGGVQPRVMIAYQIPENGVSVTGVDAEYRVTATDVTYRSGGRETNNGTFYLDGLNAGLIYDFRIRGVSAKGLPGPWTYALAQAFTGKPVLRNVALTLLEQVNSPQTPNKDLSTVIATITPPSPVDPNFAYALIEFRRADSAAWFPVGNTDANKQAREVLNRDGTAYVFRARSVSVAGYIDSDGTTASITLSSENGSVDPAPDPGATADAGLNVTGLKVRGHTPPDYNFEGRDLVLDWTPVTAPAGQTLRDYRVQIVDPATSNVLRNEYVVAPTYTYDYARNLADALAAGYTAGLRSVIVKVVARSLQGHISATPAQITASNPAPTLPVGFAGVTAFYTAVQAKFPRPTDTDFAGVRVYMSTVNGFTPGPSNLVYDKSETNPINIDGLTDGATYYFRFILYDLFGDGPTSSQYSATTAALPGHDTTPPTVPGAITLAAAVEQIQLFVSASLKASWGASTDDSGSVFYEGEYWTSAAPTKITTFRTPSTNFNIFPVQIGQTYNVRVRALDYNGNASAYATTATLTITGDSSAPGNVTSASATGGLDKSILAWTNPTDADFLEVEISRSSTGSGGTYTVIDTSRGTTYVDANVVNGTAYHYKFRTKDVTGNFSALSSAVGPATPFSIGSGNIGNYIDLLAIGNAYIQNLDAAKITTGFLAAARIAAGTIIASMLSVSTLSSITANVGTLTSGSIRTVSIISSASGNARSQMIPGTGIQTYNSSNQNTATLGEDGAGFVGLAPGVIQWTTGGAVTIAGTVTGTGTISGPLFQTSGTWKIEAGAQALALDGDPSTTFVLVYRNGSSSKFRLDQLGNMRLGGNLEIDTGGDVHSGKTTGTDSANAGWFLGNESGTPKFYIGSASDGEFLKWDGTLSLKTKTSIKFDGDRGDGTVSTLLNIALTAQGAGIGSAILNIGDATAVAAANRCAMFAQTNGANIGVYVKNPYTSGTAFRADAAGTGGSIGAYVTSGTTPLRLSLTDAAGSPSNGMHIEFDTTSAFAGRPTWGVANGSVYADANRDLWYRIGGSWGKFATKGTMAANPGFAELGNGGALLWGTTTVNANSSLAVNMGITLAATGYVVVVSPHDTSTAVSATSGVSGVPLSTTQITLYNRDGVSRSIDWHVTGKVTT